MVAIAAVLFATVRIIATYPVFSHVVDEPVHIATGMQWLQYGSYTWEPQHPPLARVAAAIGPYLLGRRAHQSWAELYHEGVGILYQGDRYDRTLAAARLGILPFFWIACSAVWAWARRYYGARAAALSVVVFTFVPTVLAHAGLATTDMAVTAFTTAAFVAALFWADAPDWRRAVVLGAMTGLAVISKFSSLAFLPATIGAAAIASASVRLPDPKQLAALRRGLSTLGLAALAAAFVIWAAYRFAWHGLPAPALYQGISDVLKHNQEGHLAFLLGQLSRTGWWYFFPVLLAYKTPLALLLLVALWAAIPALRRRWETVLVPLAFSAAILGVGMAGNINIGLRHILPVYAGMAILGAVAAEQVIALLWGRKWAGGLLGVLALWFGISSLLAHPDYLPYFNELAAGKPEEIAVDSDLEWGQDLKRLSSRVRQLGSPHITLLTIVVDDYGKRFPGYTTTWDTETPSPGWTAVDITAWKKRFGLDPSRGVWMDRVTPAEKVGAGYYLWNIPPLPPSSPEAH